MYLLPLVLLSLLHPLTAQSKLVLDTPYIEHISTRLTYRDAPRVGVWPELDTPTIRDVAVDHSAANDGDDARAYLLADASLYALRLAATGATPDLTRLDLALDLHLVPGSRLASSRSAAPNAPLLIATPTQLYVVREDRLDATIAHPFSSTHIVGLAVNHETSTAFVAGDRQVFKVDLATQQVSVLSFVKLPPTALHWHSACGLAIGTDAKLYRSDDNGLTHWWDWTHGLVDGAPTAFACDGQAALWIGNAACVNIANANGTYTRLAGYLHGGLPVNNVTALAASGLTGDPSVWVGSRDGGLALYSPNSGLASSSSSSSFSDWSYMNGQRWLPGNRVLATDTSMHVEAPHGTHAPLTVVATDQGLAWIRSESWTLSRKAAHLQTLVEPRHDRYGLVADCALNTPGNLTGFTRHDNDNDGLWTSLYVAAQSFRYAVTHDPQVKSAAWPHFLALQKLNHITGIKGLMARSFVKDTDPHEHGGRWYPSKALPGWTFKGDASSDEVCGHMFVYPIVHDLLAETDAERAQAKALAVDIAQYITRNNFTLVSVLGNATTWGHWDPETLNVDPFWYDERGINALQILSFLSAAYRLSGDESLKSAFDYLVKDHRYDRNMINQKITIPDDDNFSDDELAWLPYFTFWFNNGSEHMGLKNEMKLSAMRSWHINRSERSSLWNVMYSAMGYEEDTDLEEAVWCLRTWPMELISWKVHNSERQDIVVDPNTDRFGSSASQSMRVLPYNEQNTLRWNADVFTLDSGSGTSEGDPSAFLLPYWMARHYGFIQ